MLRLGLSLWAFALFALDNYSQNTSFANSYRLIFGKLNTILKNNFFVGVLWNFHFFLGVGGGRGVSSVLAVCKDLYSPRTVIRG